MSPPDSFTIFKALNNHCIRHNTVHVLSLSRAVDVAFVGGGDVPFGGRLKVLRYFSAPNPCSLCSFLKRS